MAAKKKKTVEASPLLPAEELEVAKASFDEPIELPMVEPPPPTKKVSPGQRIEALELKLEQAAEQMALLLGNVAGLSDQVTELSGRIAFLEGVLGESEPKELDKVLDAATWIEGKTEVKPGDSQTWGPEAADDDYDDTSP